MAQANEKKIIEQLDADQALRQNMETQKLSEESLDNIAGGTQKECQQLMDMTASGPRKYPEGSKKT